MLKINNLTVEVNDKKVLNDFNLEINDNDVYAIMGPNGIGKSTICKTIMGDSNYHIISGSILFNEEDLLKLDVNERAKKGIFLLNQSPIDVPGVTNSEMLKIALKERNINLSIFDFREKLESTCKLLDIPKSFIHRGINEGMSGGERKKNELLHLWMLEPNFIILDELDSGLDIDSLKLVCRNINKYKETHQVSILIITHHLELLELLNANKVSILNDGKIFKTGDISLAREIEKQGFKNIIGTN